MEPARGSLLAISTTDPPRWAHLHADEGNTMAREDFKLVVVHTGTGKRFAPRDVHAKLDGDRDRDEWREHLIAIAQTNSYLTSGGVQGWIGEFEGLVFTEREFRKNPDPGGWGTPERTLRFAR